MNTIVELSADAFFPESSCHHYLSMAKNIIDYFEDREEVRIKSYLYSLRTILCCKWIISRLIQPPMKIQDLLNEFLPSGELRELADKLIDLKNDLPRGKPRSIGAKTTGVARSEISIFRAHLL